MSHKDAARRSFNSCFTKILFQSCFIPKLSRKKISLLLQFRATIYFRNPLTQTHSHGEEGEEGGIVATKKLHFVGKILFRVFYRVT